MEILDVTDKTAAIEATFNEGFRTISDLMPGMGEKVTRLGARFECRAQVSDSGLSIVFDLKMDNIQSIHDIDPITQIDIYMVQAFAQAFADRNLNR